MTESWRSGATTITLCIAAAAAMISTVLTTGLWSLLANLVDTAAEGLGGDSLTNLNVWLFAHDAGFDGQTTCATIWCCEEETPIRLGELVDGDDTDAGCVVATVTS